MNRLISHLRGSAVGYVALFFALTAPASAFVITGELITDDSVTGRDVRESTLVTPRDTVLWFDTGSATAECPAGMTATGGGAQVTAPGGNGGNSALAYSRPGVGSRTSWTAGSVDPAARVTVWVLCSV